MQKRRVRGVARRGEARREKAAWGESRARAKRATKKERESLSGTGTLPLLPPGHLQTQRFGAPPTRVGTETNDLRMTSADKTGDERPRRDCTRDGYGCVPASRVLPAREGVLRGCLRLVTLVSVCARGGCWIKGWTAMAMRCQPTAWPDLIRLLN